MLLDLKAALRKVFTDHAVYTNWLIVESVPVAQEAAADVATRLLRNPADIRRLLEPFLGSERGALIERVFTEHLKLAAAALEPVRNHDTVATEQAVAAFFTNGDEVAAAISSINPNKLDFESARIMFHEHNQFVVDLASLRSQRRFAEQIALYDPYYRHMMVFSDMIYETLTP